MIKICGNILINRSNEFQTEMLIQKFYVRFDQLRPCSDFENCSLGDFFFNLQQSSSKIKTNTFCGQRRNYFTLDAYEIFRKIYCCYICQLGVINSPCNNPAQKPCKFNCARLCACDGVQLEDFFLEILCISFLCLFFYNYVATRTKFTRVPAGLEVNAIWIQWWNFCARTLYQKFSAIV